MTREEILAMEPGRELDALAAKKVLGKDLKRCGRIGGCLKEITGNPKAPCVCDKAKYSDRPYSTDISAAWEVVEKLQESHLYTDIRTCADFYEVWITIHENGNQTETFACPKLPEAICKAALLAILDT